MAVKETNTLLAKQTKTILLRGKQRRPLNV